MASVSFEFLFKPAEDIDTWLTGLFDGAPLLVALAIAFLLGLRHASDPDHLVAVTSLVAAEDGDTRAAARLGAWWGLGHAAMLVVIGIPLIAFKSELPVWLESGAEKAIGLVIVVQNFISSLLNSHLFDFHEGWIYVLGVGVAGGIVARAQRGSGSAQARNWQA